MVNFTGGYRAEDISKGAVWLWFSVSAKIGYHCFIAKGSAFALKSHSHWLLRIRYLICLVFC
jgi:hypothetical protein